MERFFLSKKVFFSLSLYFVSIFSVVIVANNDWVTRLRELENKQMNETGMKQFRITKRELIKNAEELIAQKQMINICSQILDFSVVNGNLSTEEASQAKNELNQIFEDNLKKASYKQRLIYNVKKPFQYIYDVISRRRLKQYLGGR